MGTVNQKIRYTKLAVDDIELALNEKGINTNDVPLSVYGNLIRSLGEGSGGGSLVEFEESPQLKFIAKEYIAQNATYNMVKKIFEGSDIFYWIDNNSDYLAVPNAVKIDYVIEKKEE